MTCWAAKLEDKTVTIEKENCFLTDTTQGYIQVTAMSVIFFELRSDQIKLYSSYSNECINF